MNNQIRYYNQVYVFIDVIQHAFPLQCWWQQILHIVISLCLFELAFGAVGQFFRQQEYNNIY